MTDELSRAAAEPEEAVPALLSEMHPSEADAVTAAVGNAVENNWPGKVTIESPPDWLKPMEEDEDEGAEVRSGEHVAKKTNDDAQKVKRRRGRPPKARNARHGLTRLDLKKGLRVDRAMKKTVGSLLESKRPSFSSRGAPAAPTPTHMPEVLPRRPQSLAHIPLSAPQRPRPVPDCPTGGSGLEFHSPPHLTRLSPLSIDTSGTRSFILSPSVKVGNVSPQTLSAEPGKDGLEPPLRLWLCPSLEPISPVKTQDISEQSLSPPGFPEAVINGALPLKESLPLLSQCGNCGCPFSVQKPGDSLCFRCRPKPEKKHSPPNIVFRKVGQDQWEVGKTKDPRKQILAPRGPKYKKIVKMVGQDQWEVEKSKHPRKQILDFVPDGGDEDEDEWASKKRNRRMCRRCVACLREDDCGKCDFCMDKPKFGGSNKKRQKCRLRQCKFQSKLHFRNKNGMPTSSLPRMRRNLKPKLKRRGRPPKKRKFRSHPWEEEEEVSDEDEGELRRYEMNGSKARARRPWDSFKEEDAMFVEAVIEDDDPSNMEEDPVVLGRERSVMASNEIYTNASGLGAQGLFYNMSAMPVPSPMVGSVALSTNPPLPMGEVMSSLPAGDDISQNGFLQIEMVRVGSPPSLYMEEPQNTQAHTCEPQQEPTPVITQIFSLAGSEGECDRDQGLIELFTSLGQTVLPAHWVGVMAKGPVLQLLQCSKLSTMADTVVQIEKGFFYQVSVQNQPLLLMHAVYSRHPTCLETVDEVVSLLLDLENLGVCQGYQNLDMCSPWEPRMCVRAALCDLLISKDEEHCGKCSQPAEG